MSRHLHKFGDSGDRRLHDTPADDAGHARIRFLPPRQCDWKISMPKELAERAEQGGKHRDNLRYELAILWRRYVKDGEFSVSMRMVEELYSSRFRKCMKAILDDTASVVKAHSNFTGNMRCQSYKFKFGRPKKRPTYNGIPPGPDDPPLPRPDQVRVTLRRLFEVVIAKLAHPNSTLG